MKQKGRCSPEGRQCLPCVDVSWSHPDRCSYSCAFFLSFLLFLHSICHVMDVVKLWASLDYYFMTPSFPPSGPLPGGRMQCLPSVYSTRLVRALPFRHFTQDQSLVGVEFKTTASVSSVSAGAGWVENLPVVCFSTISSWFTEYIVAVFVNNFWWAFAFQLFICGLLAIVIVIVLQWCQI